MKKYKLISIGLVICVIMAAFAIVPGTIVENAYAADGESETVNVTVNYVYKSNNAMVAQPYSAVIPLASDFVRNIAIPQVTNYSPEPESLPEGVTLDTENDLLKFDIQDLTEDIEILVYYVAGQSTYTVNHYYQNLENDDYELGNTVSVTGDIDAYTKAVAENKTGFVCTGVPEYIIAADGTTVVNIYYDREKYMVQFDVNGGVNGPEPVYGKYGASYVVPEGPTRAGYTFDGWKNEDTTEYLPAVGTSETIEANVTYVAQWKANVGTADYTIVIWGQNANNDEYSYLHSYPAYGQVGSEVTWDEDALICESLHTHKDDCYEFICTKEVHTHDDCTLICGKEEHQHSTSCYEGVGRTSAAGIGAPSDPQNGTIARQALSLDGKVIYIDGTWYAYSGSTAVGSVAPMTCEGTHSHSDSCYGCNKEAHTHTDKTGDCYQLICGVENAHESHTDACYMSSLHPDKNLWIYEKCEEVVVDADGSTVLNVYFKRVEFTLTFKDEDGSTIETIVDRWGADIKTKFDKIETDTKAELSSNEALSGWKDSTTNKYTNYVGIMPQQDKTFTANIESANESLNTMTYYFADLNGDYQKGFDIQFRGDGYTVTTDEYYEIEGFTINKSDSTSTGSSCKGAKFYYDRNSYNLEFYSASNSTPDKTANPLYQEPLAKYDYNNPTRPATIEKDAVFVGWYQNPECTGEEFILEEHNMPANNIALYAKWKNRDYTVTTYTDETMTTLYTYEGYPGSQQVEKYTTAKELTQDPAKEGMSFVGWFYKDGEIEKPFSFGMSVTKDYDLYPKFAELKNVSYIVHYYIENTTTKVADDQNLVGAANETVTLKAKMGDELNLAEEGKIYFPLQTSTSVVLTEDGQEITFYYKEATDVTYTVKYVDPEGNELLRPKTVTTTNTIVTEKYEPVENYTARQYQQTLELSADANLNVIIFVYDPNLTDLKVTKDGADLEKDPNQVFIFEIVGTDEKTKGIKLQITIYGNDSVMVCDLPVGSYKVTELEDWSYLYTAENAEQTINLNVDASKNEVTFKNNRKESYWLTFDNYVENAFTAEELKQSFGSVSAN